MAELVLEHPWTQWLTALSDRHFAVLFFALLIFGSITRAAGLALWRGRRTRQLTGKDDPYAIALAAGGVGRAVTVALMMLSSHGFVKPSAVKGQFMPGSDQTPVDRLHDWEKVVLAVCRTGEQSVTSILKDQKIRVACGLLEQRAVASGLLRSKPNVLLRFLWASPMFAAAIFAGLRVMTGMYQGQAVVLVGAGTVVAAFVALMSVNTAGEFLSRRLFSVKAAKHPALANVTPISGAPSVETYGSMRQSAVPALAGLGGVAAVSGCLLFWSAANTDMLVAAERALMSTAGGGDASSSGSDSSCSDSGSSCGGGCGGCG